MTFLKFSYSTKGNIPKYWITHRMDNELLCFFSIVKFKAILWFKREVTISRLVHFYHIIFDFGWNYWAYMYRENFHVLLTSKGDIKWTKLYSILNAGEVLSTYHFYLILLQKIRTHVNVLIGKNSCGKWE